MNYQAGKTIEDIIVRLKELLKYSQDTGTGKMAVIRLQIKDTVDKLEQLLTTPGESQN